MPSLPNNTPFQALQNAVFDTTLRVMGFVATWDPASGGEQVTGRVHFKNPTKVGQWSGVEFNPEAIQAEYKFGDFDGLKESADARIESEVLVIDEIEYYVLSVSADFDGKTYIAYLKPVPE